MTMQSIPGLTYRGYPCSYDDDGVPGGPTGSTGATGPTGPTGPTAPPSGGATVYPPELAPKNKSQSTMPWVSGTRLSGPTITHTTAWIVNFHTGAPSTRDVRLTAVQREGGPIARIAILFRRSDGHVVSRLETSSITFNCLVGQPPKDFRVPLEANVDYAMGIYNVHDEAGAMFSDLYL